MAMGIAGMTAAVIGSGGFPILINWLIPICGWRVAFMLLGLGVLMIMLPLGTIFIRNRPEDYGLHPDGTNSVFAENDAAISDPKEEHWTLPEAICTRSFWIAGAGLASGSMLSTGLFFHLFSIFKDNGLSSTVAASVFLPMAVTTGIMHLGGGVLVDRMPIRVILTISLLLQTLALIMAPYLRSVELAWAFGLVMGIRGGFGMVVSNVIWAKFYGRLHLGSITGVTTTLMVASSALGPMPFGVARDIMGSYTAVLIGFAGLPSILAVAALLYCKPPTRP
jgi:sugar phosphate permease